MDFMTKYETVAASQSDQALGAVGKAGDVLEGLVVTVSTSATGTVSIKDGSTSITITAANTPIGVYTVRFGKQGMRSTSGAWSVTTGAGASVIAIGQFT